MSNRKGLTAAAAAFAALAISGMARADEAKVASPLSLDRVALMQDAPERTPLMSLLNEAGLARPFEDAGITVGGHIQGSYTYGFSSPLGNDLTGRYFDFENQDPTLNQIDIFFDKAVASDKFDVGGRIEWIYGADTRLIHALGLFDHHGVDTGPENWFDLFQAYVDVNLPVGNGLKLRVGKFASPIGYETVVPTGNDLFSHTFSFGYGVPFTHVGVTASTQLTDALSVTGGITRGWDVATEDNNDTIDVLGQLAYKYSDKQTILFNFLVGPDQPGNNEDYRAIFDFQYIHQVADNFKVAFNGIYAWEKDSESSVSGSDAQWFAAVVYAGLTLNEYVSVNSRVEYFNDQDGARLTGGVGGTSLYDATLGLSIKPFPNDKYGSGLVIRPEIRVDYAEDRYFDGGTDYIQTSAAIDAVYRF
jgi:hypothetical protein